MTRTRLRPAYTTEQLAEVYRTPHDHTRWADHHLRVDVTIEVARWMCRQHGLQTVSDLSCGDAAIANALTETAVLGDYAPGYTYQGPIERTIDEIPPVDLFICSETIEHLDDPDMVLRKIRAKARCLVLSTPEGETGDSNPEHYWGWTSPDVEEMLRAAGFTPVVHNVLGLRETVYDYQIWGCR